MTQLEKGAVYPHLNNCILSYNELKGKKCLSIRIDSEQHHYLKDHVFGKESFVPATVIMELLFEAAFFYCETTLEMDISKLLPKKLEKFDIQRALKMKPGDSIVADFIYEEVTRKDDDVCFELTIASDRLSADKKPVGRRVNTKARVSVGKEAYEAPAFSIPEEQYIYYQLDKTNFYRVYFPSLGYFFQTNMVKFAVNEDRTHYIGAYNCDGKEKAFIKDQDSAFITSPLGNDSCLQAAVFFSRMINLIGRLPVGGEELYFYRKHPLSGEVHVYIEKVEIADNMTCNIVSYDKDGVIFYAKNFVVGKSPYHKLLDRDALEKAISSQTTEPFDL